MSCAACGHEHSPYGDYCWYCEQCGFGWHRFVPDTNEGAGVRRETSKARLRRTADMMFSRLVRSVGHCEYVSLRVGPIRHGGPLQCAHILSRRYLATRYDRINAVCLCAAHHVYFTHHPLEWEDWSREELGSVVYDELRRKAMKGGRPDYGAIIVDLRAQLASAEASAHDAA